MRDLQIAISPCPNDTFIFGSIALGLVKSSYNFNFQYHDISALNDIALNSNKLDLVKVSYAFTPYLSNSYKFLHSGGALGFACGPLVLSKKEFTSNDLSGLKILIPGKTTTAYKLFNEFFVFDKELVEEALFDEIIPKLDSGYADIGVVIHEGRFIYKNYNLNILADLGELWENRYKSPIPLGVIAINNRNIDIANDINTLIKESILYARENYDKLHSYIKKHANINDDSVILQHINLYVNDFSLNMLQFIDSVIHFTKINRDSFI